jgi:alpha-mannosidase
MSDRTNVPTIHLVCNAHIDPVWQWEWEEGASTALATFKVAADLCEEFPAFIFNHNEAVLYQWIEAYDPPLFRRIQRLVRKGRWHIMGGWWLQPDCNMPAGEGFVRQALHGKRYFLDKFGVEPRTAINFDPFGHDRGLVQILAKSGYDSYVVTRPDSQWIKLPADTFRWRGYDGSEVLVCRPLWGYGSRLGDAVGKIEALKKEFAKAAAPCHLLLWGVGNHGGGPSREDLRKIGALLNEDGEFRVIHSIPEAYFDHLRESGAGTPTFAEDLRPWGVGCYTSMVQVKQQYRELENDLFVTEKLLAMVCAGGLMKWPARELGEAVRDMLLAQFHDSLPGSSIEAVEHMILRICGHGREILSRIRAHAVFALSGTQAPAKDGEIPVLVFNPHPYPVDTTVECEFMMADQNWKDSFTTFTVRRGKRVIPSQIEQERSNLSLDWRKRIVFRAQLPPSSMVRFDCVPGEPLPARRKPDSTTQNGLIERRNRSGLDIAIGAGSGLIERFRMHGRDALGAGACLPRILADTPDPWGMRERGYKDVTEDFRLMDPVSAADFSGVSTPQLEPVRVIEEGPVRTVVEALLAAADSRIRIRYTIPAEGAGVGIEVRVHWMETDRMLKLEFPMPLGMSDGWRYAGEAAFGVSSLPSNGDEAVAHRWVAAVNDGADLALTCINTGAYGSDFTPERLRLTLLRSPAYCAHPIGERPLVPQDRHTARMDQGVRTFRFALNAGKVAERLAAIGREAEAVNEAPFAVNIFPTGSNAKNKPGSGLQISDPAVLVPACKRTEDGKKWLIRLFEPTGEVRRVKLAWPAVRLNQTVPLKPFELLTLTVDPRTGMAQRTDLVERTVG